MNHDRWYYRPVVVLVLLFLVLGPFALPLLYQSPSFTPAAKFYLTIIVIAYIIWLVGWSFSLSHSLVNIGY